MESYECPNCGYLMNENDEVCKYCGSPNPKHELPRESIFASSSTDDTKNKNSASNNSGKKMDALIFILLIFLFWPAAIIYAIVCAAKK